MNHRYTGAAHLLRQLRHRQGNAVLHVHLVDIDISALIKEHVHRAGTGVGGERGDVGGSGHTVDLLLQHIGDRLFRHQGVGTAIGRRDLNLRRGNVGKVLNRQGGDRDQTHQHDQDAADGGENRPLDEIIGERHWRASVLLGARRHLHRQSGAQQRGVADHHRVSRLQPAQQRVAIVLQLTEFHRCLHHDRGGRR